MSVIAASPTPTKTAGFGVIAERFRRAGQPEKAVALCREGLEACPDHLSARVTLGWSLLDLGEYQEAFGELKTVLKRAPDNLAAIRGLAELHERGVGLDHESFTATDDEHDLDSFFDPMTQPAAAELPSVETALLAPAIAEPMLAHDEHDEHDEFDPIVEPAGAEPMLVEVVGAGEVAAHIDDIDVLDDLSSLFADEPAPISLFERAPLALRDEFDEARVDQLHAWLSRVRERRTETMAQYDMAG